VDPLAALLTVAGVYALAALAWRRVLIWRRRTSGPELALLASFDHAALAHELSAELAPPPGDGEPAPPVAGPAGIAAMTLPTAWATCAFATSPRFAAARAAIARGDRPDVPDAERRGLLAWACLARLFAGDAEGAAACARALQDADAGLAARLEAQVLARRVELLPEGEERRALCEAALASCRAAGLARAGAPVGLAGLAAHLETLRIDVWTLEIGALRVRRALDRIERRAPHAPFVHLTRAHLAAMLGDGEAATEHLARAL
jgi:hypothetical protein